MEIVTYICITHTTIDPPLGANPLQLTMSEWGEL